MRMRVRVRRVCVRVRGRVVAYVCMICVPTLLPTYMARASGSGYIPIMARRFDELVT